MTTITPWKDGNKESVKFETGKIDDVKDIYLKELGLAPIEDSSSENANKLFMKVVEDFKNGKLSIDELSSFGFEIFHKIAKKNKESDLFQARLSASELSFAVRNQATSSNISSYLSDIDAFYQKNN